MKREVQKQDFPGAGFMGRHSSVIMIYLFLFVFMAAISFAEPDFCSVRNFRNLAVAAFSPMMIAFAQGMVVLTGGIDLSLGGIVAMSNVLCVTLMQRTGGFAAAILVTIAAGVLCGCLNGLLITKGRLAPIIVTLAANWVYAGTALFIMPAAGGKVHMGFAKFMNDRVFGIPVAVYLIAAVLLVIRVQTEYTSFGKALRAIGGNESAAYSTGIHVDRVKLRAYVTAGILASFSGIFLAAQMYSGDPKLGESYSMNAVTAVVLGGFSLSGATGDMCGVVAGVFLVTIINNMLNLMGISSFYQYIVQGVILIIALSMSSVRALAVKYGQRRSVSGNVQPEKGIGGNVQPEKGISGNIQPEKGVSSNVQSKEGRLK